MRFEQVKRGRKDNKAIKLNEEFLETRYDRVEVHNEDDYESNASMAAALRFVVGNYFPDKLQVNVKSERVYLTKIKNRE